MFGRSPSFNSGNSAATAISESGDGETDGCIRDGEMAEEIRVRFFPNVGKRSEDS